MPSLIGCRLKAGSLGGLHYSQPPPPQPTTLKVKGGPGRPLTLDRKRPYPCELCPSKFGSKMELEEHQNSHTGEKPFECDVCKARFNRRSTLWNHKRIHSDTKPFCCPVCGMTFKWKNSLKCHKEMHLRKNEAATLDLDNAASSVTYAGSHRKTATPNPNCKKKKVKGPPMMMETPQMNIQHHVAMHNHVLPSIQIKSEPGLLDMNGRGYIKTEVSTPTPPQSMHYQLSLAHNDMSLVGQSHSSIQVEAMAALRGDTSVHSNSSSSGASSGGYSPPSDPAPPQVDEYPPTTSWHQHPQHNGYRQQTHVSPNAGLPPPHAPQSTNHPVFFSHQPPSSLLNALQTPPGSGNRGQQPPTSDYNANPLTMTFPPAEYLPNVDFGSGGCDLDGGYQYTESLPYTLVPPPFQAPPPQQPPPTATSTSNDTNNYIVKVVPYSEW